MKRYCNIFCSVLLGMAAIGAKAQTSGCNSSYSLFGLGLLDEQSDGFRKSMGDAGLGTRIGNRLNTSNPAAGSAIDSLSFIMDVGMKGSFGKMTQENRTVGVNNASLDYVHVGFRLSKRFGLMAGFLPYSSIGYSFSSQPKTITNDINTTLPITSSNVYKGNGGLSQVYVSLGGKVIGDLSLGIKAGFMWGDYYHSVGPSYEEGGQSGSSYSSVYKIASAKLRTYKMDFGIQYPVRLDSENKLTLGMVVSNGHKIAQDVEMLHYTTMGDTTTVTAQTPFDLPWTFGGGVTWEHKNHLLVAADIRNERWGNCHLPNETTAGYKASLGGYTNRTKAALGAQWTPNVYSKNYLKRIQYRAGISYSTPYLKVNGQDGPYELSMNIGAGLPTINNRTVVHCGLQWLRRSASGAHMVTEDYLLLNIGVTFNEHWFQKFKIK